MHKIGNRNHQEGFYKVANPNKRIFYAYAPQEEKLHSAGCYLFQLRGERYAVGCKNPTAYLNN